MYGVRVLYVAVARSHCNIICNCIFSTTKAEKKTKRSKVLNSLCEAVFCSVRFSLPLKTIVSADTTIYGFSLSWKTACRPLSEVLLIWKAKYEQRQKIKRSSTHASATQHNTTQWKKQRNTVAFFQQQQQQLQLFFTYSRLMIGWPNECTKY